MQITTGHSIPSSDLSLTHIQRGPTSATIPETPKRDALRAMNKFTVKHFDREIGSQGSVVVPNCAKTPVENHTEDVLFKPKCLHVVDRSTEIRVLRPLDHLEYSRDRVDFSVLEEIRQLDLHRRENFVKRLFVGTKSIIFKSALRFRKLWSDLLCCF